MNKFTKAIATIMLMVAVVSAAGCKKAKLPTVETNQVSNLTTTQAAVGGFITSDGGSEIIERGVCWGRDTNPDVSANVINAGQGVGSFTCTITGLEPTTTYYVRAYAVNSVGVGYGSQVSFTTLSSGGGGGTQENYTINVSALPTDGGTVSGGGTFQQGQQCTVKATANTGYTFVNWTESGNQVSDNANYSFIVNGNRTLVANFTFNPQNYTISVSANPSNGGSVSGGGTFLQGQSCTVRATAAIGYTFQKWTMSGIQMSTDTSYTFQVMGNSTLVANFDATPQAPTGTINGLFSVSATQQVYFSQGILQYKASTNTWRFAQNQWDFVGNDVYGTVYEDGVKCKNEMISSTYNGWIDLFGWGTSGYHDSGDSYNVNCQPWSTSKSLVNLTFNYYGYGPSLNMVSPSLTGSSAEYDWGVCNAIINGGNQTGIWRTLTINEWDYVFNTRSTPSGIRFVNACVNDVCGVILLPDDWRSEYYTLNNPNTTDIYIGFNSNTITSSQWNSLEQHGAVFLPVAGIRDGTSVYCIGNSLGYWSSSYKDSIDAYYLSISNLSLSPSSCSRYLGQSVRLVRNVQ